MNTDKYILQEVTTSAQEREWLDLPKKIYKGNRNWVCPLDQDITEVFDPARNELFADGEAVRWVVRNRAGEVVGRIAAFYNREKAALEEQPTGGCGFFESIDDQQVAVADTVARHAVALDTHEKCRGRIRHQLTVQVERHIQKVVRRRREPRPDRAARQRNFARSRQARTKDSQCFFIHSSTFYGTGVSLYRP